MNKPEAKPEKMNLASMDVAEEKRDELKRCLGQAFPEVFAEGAIDFDQLKRVLGEWVDPGKERFGLNWPGKAECMKIIQHPSVATLKPKREESVDFDTTANLFIEGDNLEVLKLLQKAYFGKIKMIYIDPPYNTGNEFIYPDKYAETLETYLSYTGQIDDEGRKFSTNSDVSGRYHTRWMSMMFPRLYLARNLLREDGAIFVSIDDHEVSRLRELCDQIFGEENFVATIIWQKVYAPKNSAKFFSDDHDYILVYARNAEVWRPELLERTAEQDALYKNPDSDSRGPWMSDNLTARNFYGEGSYEVTGPSGKKFSPGKGRYWPISESKFHELNSDGRIWWGVNGDSMPRYKRYLSEVSPGRVPQTLWTYDEVGHTQDAKRELNKYVPYKETENTLNSVKPVNLIRRMIKIATKDDGDIVLDFFGGSGTTGQAVIEQSLDDGIRRRFVIVQLPEQLPKPEDEFRTLSDFARARLRNVIAESKSDLLKKDDRSAGFKSFALDRSNFKVWEGDATDDADGLGKQVEMHIDHLSDSSSAEDVLYELLLKAGFPLSTKVEAVKLTGKEVFSIEEGALLICLEKEITADLIDALADANPLQVICLDEGFKGNDQLKANAVQTFRARAEAEESEIVFKTV